MYYINSVPNIKILIDGTISSGKTSLLIRYTENHFNNPLKNSVSKTKKIEVNKILYNLFIFDQIYNIPGPTPLPKKYLYARYSGIIMTFDVKNESFSEFEKMIYLMTLETEIPIIFALNKCDLFKKEDLKDIIRFAENKFIKYVCCSAKTGEGVDELFYTLISEIISPNGYWAKIEEQDIRKNLINEFSKQNNSCF